MSEFAQQAADLVHAQSDQVTVPVSLVAARIAVRWAAAAKARVMCRPGLVLRGLEALLDRPAGRGRPDDLRQRGAGRRVGEVVGQLAVGERAADQQRVLELRVGGGVQWDQGPGVLAQPVGAVAGGADLPGFGGQDRGQGAGVWRRGPNQCV
ncbi:hypothetical protein [Streptomyces sp. V1I1]|uniref:hypothetical protein n=1 Tax=Streptomyces sp. V1I1 TaxID=3042272 RepID=UPI0027858D74|nr:hypothetical protein [Streptomyces sp. V1I1]MDQ0938676.1 hypothetical protein [Streptomyces sp. V1I1]